MCLINQKYKIYKGERETTWKCNFVCKKEKKTVACPIRVKTVGDNRPSSEIKVHSSHMPDPNQHQADWQKYRMLGRSLETTENARTITTHGFRDLPLACATLVPSTKNMGQMFRYHRRKKFGKAPESREDINIPEESRRTIPDEQGRSEIFFLEDSGVDDPDRILFASEKNIRWLKKYLEWYVDGTFNISPKLFKQLFTIQVVANGFNLPLVYALLPDKKTETYHKMFQMLAGHT